MFQPTVLGVLVLALVYSATAFRGVNVFGLERIRCTPRLSVGTMMEEPVSKYADESLRRQMLSNRKAPINVVVEERKISVKAVPSLSEIETAAKNSERSKASKTFCSRSGGYPDLDVKDGIYLLLWASMTHNLQQTQAASSISNSIQHTHEEEQSIRTEQLKMGQQ